MPGYDHILTKAECENINAAHTILSAENQRWVKEQCRRVDQQFGYELRSRASMDNALRLYLIADKGFKLEDALDLSKMAPNVLMDHFRDFFTTYFDENKPREELLRNLGAMHRRAFDKISEYRFQDFSQIRSMNDMKDFYAFSFIYGVMTTDYYQDLKLRSGADMHAYYEGAGGFSEMKRLHAHLDTVGRSISGILQMISGEDNDYQQQQYEQMFRVARSHLDKLSNRRIGEIGRIFCVEGTSIKFKMQELSDPYPKGSLHNNMVMHQFENIPGDPAFDAAIQDHVSENLADYPGTQREYIRRGFTTKPISAYLLQVQPPEDDEVRDLFELPEEEQKKLQQTFCEMYLKNLNDLNMFMLYDSGISEFDLLMTRDKESIRELVNRKYPGMDEAKKSEAMMMEAVRHTLTDGIWVRDVRRPGAGELNAQGEPYPQGTFITDQNNPVFYTRNTDAEIAAEERAGIEEGLTATRDARVAMLYDQNGLLKDTVTGLTEEQLQQASEMYDRIYGAALNSINAKKYKNLHPGMEDVDFFQVAGVSLRDYLGPDRVAELSRNGGSGLKAEILRITSDPRLPFTVTSVGYNEADNTYSLREQVSIVDLADKKRIEIEFPYLTNIRQYKAWAVPKYGLEDAAQLDDGQWNGLYQAEYYQRAAEGMHRADRVLTEDQFMERSENPRIPHATTFEGFKSMYGPRPFIVEGWLGDGRNAVYTRDLFRQYMNDLPQGNFTDGDFTLIAYYASTCAEVVTEDQLHAIPDEWVSRLDKLHARATMWTTDFSVAYPTPRPDLGINFFASAIKPARDAASRMILDYEAGRENHLADRLADGITFVVKSVQALGDIDNPQGAAAQQLFMLRKTQEMLEKYPELGKAVRDRMTPEANENLLVLLRLEEVFTQSLYARQRMAGARENGEVIPAEEKEELLRKVNAFGTYSARWREYHKEYEKSPDYQRALNSSVNRMMERIAEHPEMNQAIGDAQTCEADKYMLDHKGFAPDIRESLLSDDPYRVGEALHDSVNSLKEYYRDRLQRYQNAIAIQNTMAGGQFTEEISPEQCDLAAKEREVTGNHLESLYQLVRSRLHEDQKERIMTAYNEKAAAEGWPPVADLDNDSANQSPLRYPERFKALFDLVMEEIEEIPDPAFRIEAKLEGIKAPTELSFEEKLDYPMDPQLEGIRRRNPQLSREDRILLHRVSGFLAETKPEIKNSIARENDRSSGDFLREEKDLRAKLYYSAVSKSFIGLLKKREFPGSNISVQVIAEDQRENVQKLLSEPPQISEELMQSGVQAIQMMESLKLLEPEDEPAFGSRICSHHKSARARIELAAAVDKADMNRIRRAEEKYRLAFENEKMIFDFVKETIGEASGIPSGMSSLREKAVAPEFSQDTVTDSRMNALYQVGITAKKLGISVTEYVKNPGKYLLENVEQQLKEKGFSSMTAQGDDFAASMKKLYSRGQGMALRRNMRHIVLGGLSGDAFTKEAFGNLLMLEKDPLKRREMLAYQKQIGQLIDAAVDRENAACTCIFNMLKPGTQADKSSLGALRESLKQAFLGGEGIKKEHLALPYTNDRGEEMNRPDAYRNLLARPNAYGELTELYRRNLQNAKSSNMNETKLVMQEALLDYLSAHPEDRDKKEYKILEKLAFAADRDLGITPPADAAEAAGRPRARYEQRKREFDRELRNLDNAVTRVDQEVNQRIRRLQGQANDALRGRHPDRATAWNRVEQIEELVQGRQTQLLEAWNRHEITDSYFRARYEDLHQLLLNPSGPVKNPPRFVNSRNPQQYASDLALINNRLNYSFDSPALARRSGTQAGAVSPNGIFRSLDSYKAWAKSRPDAQPADFIAKTEEQWKQDYREELFRHTAKLGTPNWIKMKSVEAAERIRARRAQRANDPAANHNAAVNNPNRNNAQANHHNPQANPDNAPGRGRH